MSPNLNVKRGTMNYELSYKRVKKIRQMSLMNDKSICQNDNSL